MPYIQVDPDALIEMSKTLKTISKNVGKVKSGFSGIRIDKDIRSASNIKRRIDDISESLDDYKERLDKMHDVLRDVKKLYDKAQEKDEDLQTDTLKDMKSVSPEYKDLLMTEEELEDRRKAAAIGKGLVFVGCAIITVAVTVATGGAGAAVVIAGIGTGALSGALNNGLDQYAAGKDLNDMDWASIGKDAVIGGIAGGVTSGIGVGANKVTNLVVDNVVKNVSGKFARMGAKVVIETGFGVIEGGVQRFADTGIRTGDWSEAGRDALDGEAIAWDIGLNAGFSAVNTGVEEFKKSKVDRTNAENVRQATAETQAAVDKAATSHNRKNGTKSVNEAARASGINGVKEGPNLSADFKESDVILRNANGEPASFKVKGDGKVSSERNQVKKYLEEGNFDTDGKNIVYHRLADYNVETGEYTVQLVDAAAMKRFNNEGGKRASAHSMYRNAHGCDAYGSTARRSMRVTPKKVTEIDLFPGHLSGKKREAFYNSTKNVFGNGISEMRQNTEQE